MSPLKRQEGHDRRTNDLILLHTWVNFILVCNCSARFLAYSDVLSHSSEFSCLWLVRQFLHSVALWVVLSRMSWRRLLSPIMTILFRGINNAVERGVSSDLSLVGYRKQMKLLLHTCLINWGPFQNKRTSDIYLLLSFFKKTTKKTVAMFKHQQEKGEIIWVRGTFHGMRMRVFPRLVRRINSEWEKFNWCVLFHLIHFVCHILNMTGAETCVWNRPQFDINVVENQSDSFLNSMTSLPVMSLYQCLLLFKKCLGWWIKYNLSVIF